MMAIPSDGGSQRTLCLDVEKVPAFMGGIVPQRCRPEIRERATEIKEELERALANSSWRGAAPRGRRARARA